MGDSLIPTAQDTEQVLLWKIAKLIEAILSAGSGAVPGAPTEQDQGAAAVSNGSDVVTVTFNRTFSSIPTSVRASISRNAGDPIIGGSIDRDTISTSGFTFALEGVVPNGNYYLDWEASV